MAGPWEQFQTPAAAEAPLAKEGPWSQFAEKPVAITSGEKQAEADKALVAKEAGIVPSAVKAGLYSAANTAAMNVPSHAVAAYESVSKSKPYWEAYKEQKQYEEALERQNPTASKIGTGIGLVGGLAVPLGPAAKIATYGAKAAAPVLGRIGGEAAGSALLGGTLSGASSLIESQDLGKAAKDAAVGAGAGAVLGPAANAIAARFAGKAPVIDKATGNLTQEAIDVGERVLGRKMTPEDITALQPQLESVMGKKGVSPEAFKEALLKEQGIEPSRSLVTGRKAPAAAEDVATEARAVVPMKYIALLACNSRM
jgi:succinate dehydrogenase/fumarate reductase flavoprotein subunit